MTISDYIGLCLTISDREECEEETPSKRRNLEEEKEEEEGCTEYEHKEYEHRRATMLSDLLGEKDGWCEECVMLPFVCLANKIELRIVEEKIRR